MTPSHSNDDEQTSTLILSTLEIADTDTKRRQGFMNRNHIPYDHGMLFLFSVSQKHCFWMKSTPVALDILLLNKDNIVIDVLYDMVPLSTQSRCFAKKSHRALEIKSRDQTKKIQIGNRIHLPNLNSSLLTIKSPQASQKH